MAIPGKLHYSPDATFISYLFSQRGDLVRDLWRLDLATGTKAQWLSPPGEAVTEENISRDEALRRERLRLRETGITDYIWAEKANVMLLPLRGELYRWAEGNMTNTARVGRVAGPPRRGRLHRPGRLASGRPASGAVAGAELAAARVARLRPERRGLHPAGRGGEALGQSSLRPASRGRHRRVHLVVGTQRIPTPISICAGWTAHPAALPRRLARRSDGGTRRQTTPALLHRLAGHAARTATV